MPSRRIVGAMPPQTEWTHTFPRAAGLASARLVFEKGVAPRLDVRSAKLDGGLLARARFPDPAPRVEQRAEVLAIDYHGFFRWFFSGRYPPGVLELSDAVPWSVEVRGGVAKAAFDLRSLALERFDVAGGAASFELRLGAPKGVTPVRLAGGAAKVNVTHAPGAGVRLRVTGGAAKVDLDDQHFGAVGGGLAVSNRHWSEKGDGFDIKIGGGAARVAIDTEGST
jgi:hypothetical protein